MSKPDSVFFDLDGTLTDPYIGIRRCIEHALQELGVETTDEDFRWCIGPPLAESFARLVGGARANKALQTYRERFSTVGWRENAPYAGIHVALQSLVEAGCELYVASSKPHVYTNRILEHFDLSPFFRGVYGAELDGTRADKTALLAFALEREATIAPVMIGDRSYDIVGAKANRMRALGVSYGFGCRDELVRAGAEAILDSPADVAAYLLA